MSYTFTWGPGPSEVIVTGTFDNWSKSFPLIKTPSGSFELTVPLPESKDKILYKYVVDGEWVISPDATIENDNGIANNVLYPSDLVSVAGSGTVVPESGLPVSNKKDELKSTVLPSSENQQQTLGEPGIVIPANAAQIDAFNTISTVDPKSLNKEEEEPVAPAPTPISTSKSSKKKKKVKKSKKKVKKNGTTATSTKDTSPDPESVTTTTTNDEETSEVASDVPAVAAAAPIATEAEEKEPVAASDPVATETVPAPIAEETKEAHKTLDPLASTTAATAEPETEVIGVEEVAPEDVAKIAEDEQVVAVEEVPAPATTSEDGIAKEEAPLAQDEIKETPKTTTTTPAPAPTAKKTPAKKTAPAKEEKKKGFFSKLKKLLS